MEPWGTVIDFADPNLVRERLGYHIQAIVICLYVILMGAEADNFMETISSGQLTAKSIFKSKVLRI
jgi:hypothetical protein